ncbi:MAG: thiamine pyrophosphate-binding protein [Deltaproteobacteria bacterium]|nr:thiamine pyrophosphate-binding protein [Deltaproteobacteria bacterium]
MKKTVAAALVDRLAAFGTEYFFQLTGGDQPLWIALHDAGIKMILTRSEFSGVYMADGYARASGKPGITYGQAGPGAANVAAALADPFWAQSPVVALTGATATGSMYKGEYQALDQMPLFAPLTKWSGFAASPERVPDLVAVAITQAMAGSRGPVHLDIPKNYFGREIEVDIPGANGFGAISTAHPEDSTVRAILELLLDAKKPVILAGDGVVRAGAEAALMNFAEALGIPVATTMGGKTSLRGDHPLNLGVIGRYSAKVANDLVGESDCVLVIGSRLGGLATNGYTVPDQKATVLQIDTDPAVFDVTYATAVRLVADARLALEALGREMKGQALGAEAAVWATAARRKAQAWREEVKAATDRAAAGPSLSPLEVIAVLASHNRGITIVADTGYMAAWTGVLYPTVRPGSYFRAIGSLGWALPASLGVQLARREKVVCVTGDGGIGYHLADIETAVRLRLPVVVVVLDNGCLGFEYHEQKYRYQGRVIPEANDLTDADYAAAARALGADGLRVRTRAEFERAFKAALESDRPTVIDVIVDREAFPPVTNFEKTLVRTI